MKRLSGMMLDSTRVVHYHTMKIRDIVAQLKSLKIKIFNIFLVHFILNSLPIEYSPFKIFYNTHKKK